MKKIVQFLIVLALLLVACTPIFAQSATNTIIPGVDTSTIFETLSAILAAIVGHYTINSKWTSIIKWLLTVVNWLLWGLSKLKSILDILNKSNLGESTDNKAVVQPKAIVVPSLAETIPATAQVADVQPTTQPPTVAAQ